MLTHPDSEDLAIYAESSSACLNHAEIEAHIKGCKSCFDVVVHARNLRDLERAGDLDSLQFQPGPKLRRYLNNPKDPAKLTGAATGALGVLAGLFTTALTPHSSHPSFALGNSRENEDPEKLPHHAVRDAPQDPSLFMNGPSPTTELEHHNEMTSAAPITQPDPVIGTPEIDAHHFPGQQSFPDTCAIRCQEFIIRQFTGVQLPESYYVDEAKDHHWYRENGGTRDRDVGNLLELHNIPVHRYAQANIFNLTAELAQGHKVIIGVHSDDLWQTHPLLTEMRHVLGLSGADHAVVVSGIDTSDPQHTQVIVSDPGTGEVAAHYPLNQFITAWKESHFFMVATQEPPPEQMHLPEMKHFDYALGHIDRVGAMPYDDLRNFLQDADSHEVGFHDRVEHFNSQVLNAPHSHDHGVSHDSYASVEDHGHSNFGHGLLDFGTDTSSSLAHHDHGQEFHPHFEHHEWSSHHDDFEFSDDQSDAGPSGDHGE